MTSKKTCIFIHFLDFSIYFSTNSIYLSKRIFAAYTVGYQMNFRISTISNDQEFMFFHHFCVINFFSCVHFDASTCLRSFLRKHNPHLFQSSWLQFIDDYTMLQYSALLMTFRHMKFRHTSPPHCQYGFGDTAPRCWW